MSKPWILLLVFFAVIVVLSGIYGNQLGAGIGALLLIATIIYLTLRQRGDRASVSRAERGARELREELDAEDNP